MYVCQRADSEHVLYYDIFGSHHEGEETHVIVVAIFLDQ